MSGSAEFAAFGAGNALPGEIVRLLGEQGAFVAADDGHDVVERGYAESINRVGAGRRRWK
ncbi:hypothetical protein [Ferribacterium limneticum]|uniref:hypothetical protein n=1 Tax=Ferribacterium limneticum TaxID=76259 RepID=UPI001CFC2E99|nr:hypothetical protein [Ferribacterium limneticum]UCV19636.1 hypothetical protein KI610_03355 [Ferribacterium limneticum]